MLYSKTHRITMKRPRAALVHANLPSWDPETRRRVLCETFPTLKNKKQRLGIDYYCLIPWGSDLALIGQEEAVCTLGSVGLKWLEKVMLMFSGH